MRLNEPVARRRRTALAHACVACRRPWAVRAMRNDDGVYLLVCRYCAWSDVRGAEGVPVPEPIEPAPADHRVLFYDSEPELLGHLSRLVADSVLADASCLLITTPEHRAGLRHGTEGRTLLLAGRRHAVELDAQDTLGLFLRDGRPDRELFEQTVGTVVRRVAAAGRPVHAYGEMVALLWAQGAVRAALELEALWNGLQREVSFSLLCAYPSRDVDRQGRHGRARICDHHTALAA